MGNEGVNIVHRLKQILGKYEQIRGIQVAGSEDSTPTGVTHTVRVDANGRLEIVGAGGVGLATEATLLLCQASLALLDNALQSIGTDYLLVGDAGSIINLDAAGDVQVDVLTSALPVGAATEVTVAAILAAQATAANQVTMITSLQLIDDLRNALDSVGTDELRTVISDPATPAQQAFVVVDCYQNLTTENPLVVTGISQGEDLEVGAGNSEPFKVRTDDNILPIEEKHLQVLGHMYAWNATFNDWRRVRSLRTISDGHSSANIFAVKTSAYISAFNDPSGNYHRVRSGGLYDNLINTASCLKTSAVVHGEDLDVGVGNSEPIKVRDDDGSLPESEKHLVVINLNYVKDGAVWVPMTQPS